MRQQYASKREDEKATTLMKYMLSNDPQECMDDTGIFKQPHSVMEWPVAGNVSLFFRKYHQEMFPQILRAVAGKLPGAKVPGVIMMGNPGIGKSMSIPYYLWKFVHNGKNVVVHDSKRKRCWIFFRGSAKVVSIASVNDWVNISELQEPETVLLWDPDANTECPPTVKVSGGSAIQSCSCDKFVTFHRHLRFILFHQSLNVSKTLRKPMD